MTVPLSPPGHDATLGISGTATHVTSMQELAKSGNPRGYKCCANTGSAYMNTVAASFPHLPVDPKKQALPTAAIIAISVTPVIIVLIVGIYWHLRRLRQQEKRMKKRFIQQLARNIDLGHSARNISAEKLTEVFQHIGGQGGQISRPDLARWMNDLNLDFLSEQDFDRLWDTIDMDRKGTVDPIDFFSFLKECDNQFEEVHGEYSTLPKAEKLKLASRRLSTINNMDVSEVKHGATKHQTPTIERQW